MGADGGGSGQTTWAGTYHTTSGWGTTMPMTTFPTTLLCFRYVDRIEVKFDTKRNHLPGSPGEQQSGDVFTGKLTYYKKACPSFGSNAAEIVVEDIDIQCGGYIDTALLAQGSDTSFPPGDYEIDTLVSSPDKDTEGYFTKPVGHPRGHIVDPDNNQRVRTVMKIHYKAREDGSAGCIVFTDPEQFTTFQKDMKKAREVQCKVDHAGHELVKAVNLNVTYDPVPECGPPAYNWVP